MKLPHLFVFHCPQVHRFLLQAVNQKNLLKKPEKGDDKEQEKREKAKKLDKENLSDERASGPVCTLAKRPELEFKDEKPKRFEEDFSRDYRDRDRDRDRDYERDQERILRERERLRRLEEERRRQKERYDKEKALAFKRKEEELKKEKEALGAKSKKPETPEPVGGAEKGEKKEEVVKRDRIRNKDRPAMQLYQPGARSRSRLLPPEDTNKPGDTGVDRKQESGISHRKEGGEE